MSKKNIAIVNFNGKKYTYEFDQPRSNSRSDIAIAISQAMWETLHKRKMTKFTRSPQHYSLIYELLGKQRYTFDQSQKEIDYWQEAGLRNLEEKPYWDTEQKSYVIPTWRIGVTFSNHIVIEIDNHDEENLRKIVCFYKDVLEDEFAVIRTNSGFWIIGKSTLGTEGFVNANLRILFPFSENLKQDKKRLLDLDKGEYGLFEKADIDKVKSICTYPKKLNFDILFTLLCIKRERATLRISKKNKNDKLEEVIL